MSIDWLWFAIGIAFAWFVLPLAMQLIGGGQKSG